MGIDNLWSVHLHGLRGCPPQSWCSHQFHQVPFLAHSSLESLCAHQPHTCLAFRSTTLDFKWTHHQLKMMECGGNERGAQFFKQHGLESNDATVKIDGKYTSRAAELYREKLKAEVGGVEQPKKRYAGDELRSLMSLASSRLVCSQRRSPRLNRRRPLRPLRLLRRPRRCLTPLMPLLRRQSRAPLSLLLLLLLLLLLSL